MAVAADPHVEDFGELDDAGNPEDQGEEEEEWESHADVPQGAGATVDFAVRREAVDRGGEFFTWDVSGEFRCFFMGKGEERNGVKPVQPGDEPHLESAEGAGVIINQDVFVGVGHGFDYRGAREWDVIDRGKDSK